MGLSRAFDTTLGVGTTDVLTSSNYSWSNNAVLTFYIEYNRRASTTFGKFINQNISGAGCWVGWDSNNVALHFKTANTTGSSGDFRCATGTAGTAGVWNRIGLTYDGSSNSNVPTWVINKAKGTNTTTTAPNAAITNGGASPWTIGNIPAGNRVIDGLLGRIAIWNTRLPTQWLVGLCAGDDVFRYARRHLMFYYNPDFGDVDLVQGKALVRTGTKLVSGTVPTRRLSVVRSFGKAAASVYNDSITLTGTAGDTEADTLTAVASQTLAGTSALSLADTLTALAALSIAGTAGLTEADILTAVAAETFSVTAGISEADILAAVGALVLSDTSTLSLADTLTAVAAQALASTSALSTADTLDAVAAETLSASSALGLSGGLNILLSQVFAATAGDSEGATLGAVGATSFGATAGLSDAGSLTLSVAFPLSGTAGISSSGGLNFNSALSFGASSGWGSSTNVAVAAVFGLTVASGQSASGGLIAIASTSLGAASGLVISVPAAPEIAALLRLTDLPLFRVALTDKRLFTVALTDLPLFRVQLKADQVSYTIGDRPRIISSPSPFVSSVNGQPTDPTTLVVTIDDPTKAESINTISTPSSISSSGQPLPTGPSGATISRASAGLYEVQFDALLAGSYIVKFRGFGAAAGAAPDHVVVVNPSKVITP